MTLTADQLVKAKVHVTGMTEWFSKPLAMNIVIQIVMISAAALMIIFCKAAPKKAVSGPVWQSGMVAVVAIYGIAWLADTYFSNYLGEMQTMLADIVKEYPWSIALVFFMVSVLINSQATVNFDRSGTTVIGKYLLNHSFMMPGLISVCVSTIVAYTLSMILY